MKCGPGICCPRNGRTAYQASNVSDRKACASLGSSVHHSCVEMRFVSASCFGPVRGVCLSGERFYEGSPAVTSISHPGSCRQLWFASTCFRVVGIDYLALPSLGQAPAVACVAKVRDDQAKGTMASRVHRWLDKVMTHHSMF